MMIRGVCFVFVALFISSTHAASPENGWWWNPAESGRGFNIEIQNRTVFVATFIYDQSGFPEWFSGGGELVNDRFSGELQRFEGGQCPDCDYTAPVPVGTLPFTIEFTGSATARVTLGGRTFGIERFPFRFDGTTRDFLGEWGLLSGSFIYIGDRVTFTRTEVLNGNLTAVGSRTGAPARLALGLRTDDFFGIGVSGITIDEIMVFNFDGVNRLEGRYWNYPKGEGPTGSGLPFTGVRIHQLAGVPRSQARFSQPDGIEERLLIPEQPVITEQDAAWEAAAGLAFDRLEKLMP